MPRALGARGALCGALGGVVAGALDFAHAIGRASAFLPSGGWKLALFLCALYGAAFAAAGGLIGLLAGLLGWATDLGAIWGAAFDRDAQPAAGSRVAAYAVALLAVLGALGGVAREIALRSFALYHSRVLIAALVGVASAALAVPAAALVFLLAATLSPILRFGPRARLRFRAPAGLEAAFWALGLAASAGTLAAIVFAAGRARWVPPAVKAARIAPWAPLALLGALALAHLLARRVGRVMQPPALFRPAGALCGVVVVLAVPGMAAAARYWILVRQLDARPWLALAIAIAVALGVALAGFGSGLSARRLGLRATLALGLPLLLLCAALSSGRNARVRKSAASFTGLTGPLVRGIHAATDLDHDGYSSVLGGGDCDDFDPTVHPGAFDWPDDGIDQNCNGHQATLPKPTPRHYTAVPASVPRNMNVVLITIDALRADHLGCYGYPRATTPNLDALARDNIRFDQAWSHAPSTRYSVPAILTGRYPSTIPVGRAWWPPNLLPENRLISEILKDRGYMTAAYLSYYYFDPRWGLNQGFDIYDTHLKYLHSQGGNPAATRGTSARELADEDLDFIAKHKDQKFFLWTHYYDTHYMFARHPDQPVTNFGDSEIDLYDGEIRYTDIELGRVFDALKSAGLWDKTIIVITSDHGDGFGEHGIPKSQRHGYHLYRNETKVPLLMHVPGLAPRVVEAPVGHIDILPTLMNLLRQPATAEPQLLGDSLLGLMLGGREPGRHVFQQVWYEGPTSRVAVVNRDWHLIRNLVPDNTEELYHLTNDLDEVHDLAGEGGADEARLDALLAAWSDEVEIPVDFARKVAGNVARKPFHPAVRLDDHIGDALVLEGVDLPRGPVAAGRPLDFTLYWRGTGRVPDGWRLFTHLSSASGRMLNADHEPLGGIYPIARLRAGTWLRDRVEVRLPAGWPAGPLAIDVGLWHGNQRAPVSGKHTGRDSTVRAATLEVVR